MWGQKQQWISHKRNIRHPCQLKKSKSWMAVLDLPAKQHCQFRPFCPICDVNGNGLDWQCYLAEMQLQNGHHNFFFFQLPRVPIIHLSLFLLSIECPDFSCIITQSQAGCGVDDYFQRLFLTIDKSVHVGCKSYPREY